MEWRSWPWKKKPSGKPMTGKPVAASLSFNACMSPVASLRHEPQEKCKNVSYVQISVDSYKHLSVMEDEVWRLKDRVKTLDDQVKDLKEKLSVTLIELDAKDNLAKQHAKVADEAVSGWENANEEALLAKAQLESVSISKLAAEDRAFHLDDALRECMREIRVLKEGNERKLRELIIAKTKQSDKIKNELEQRLSRSLQEKSEAQAEIEFLRHELHIRNEEKEMCVKSAEVANKLYLESMKKVSNLKAERQRLLALARAISPETSTDHNLQAYINPQQDCSESSSSQYTSVTSFSEDWIDEEGSSTGSSPWFAETACSGVEKPDKPQGASNLDLMHDFLEMERLACSSVDGAMSINSSASL